MRLLSTLMAVTRAAAYRERREGSAFAQKSCVHARPWGHNSSRAGGTVC